MYCFKSQESGISLIALGSGHVILDFGLLTEERMKDEVRIGMSLSSSPIPLRVG